MNPSFVLHSSHFDRPEFFRSILSAILRNRYLLTSSDRRLIIFVLFDRCVVNCSVPATVVAIDTKTLSHQHSIWFRYHCVIFVKESMDTVYKAFLRFFRHFPSKHSSKKLQTPLENSGPSKVSAERQRFNTPPPPTFFRMSFPSSQGGQNTQNHPFNGRDSPSQSYAFMICQPSRSVSFFHYKPEERDCNSGFAQNSVSVFGGCDSTQRYWQDKPKDSK